MKLLALVAVLITPLPSTALAHGGGTDANGCHNDRKRGGYHCHGGGSASGPPPPSRRMPAQAAHGDFSFRNCSQARAAGAAPVRAGDRGYGRHLDRDGDGIGCE